jgi:SAM-dependent methyltransferase
MTRPNHYTFGDTERAAERLRLLAETFAPSSRHLLSSLDPLPGGIVLDLGCGPGHTTELLLDTLRPELVIGLERSAVYVARARTRVREGLRFVQHDVTASPFPVPAADLAYVRFLITHLHDPQAAFRTWAGAVCAGGRLVVEETAAMASEDEAYREYYDIVGRLQAHHGQKLYVGDELDAFPDAGAWVIERSRRTPVALPAAAMGRLHALNIRTWREEPFIRERYASTTIDRLTADLDAVVERRRAAPPVTCTLKQLVLRRLPVPV